MVLTEINRSVEKPKARQPKYAARLAQSADEVRRAQQLRFEVFNLELGEGLAESYVTGVDIDPFDEFSDHLMVEELATSEIVGTISRGHKLGRHDGVAIQVGLAGISRATSLSSRSSLDSICTRPRFSC